MYCFDCQTDYCKTNEKNSFEVSVDWERLTRKVNPADDDLIMGFELEIEFNRRYRFDTGDFCFFVGDFICDSDFYYWSHDGSLNHGAEIKSVPATFNYLKEYPAYISSIPNFFMGKAKSFNTESCGMHVHLHRDCFSDNQADNFRKFVHNPKHYDFIRIISQRTRHKLDTWANTNSMYDPPYNEKKIKSKKGYNFTKSSAVSLCHDHTIEVRIFRGTLAEGGIYRNLEFCHALWQFSNNSPRDMSPQSLIVFINDNKELYPNLSDFVTRRFLENEKCASLYTSQAA